MAEVEAGHVYVTGASRGVNPSTGQEYVTVKYDPAGEQVWLARHNGPLYADDVPSGRVVDRSGHVYVTGGTDPVSTDGSDFLTVKYSQQESPPPWGVATAAHPAGAGPGPEAASGRVGRLSMLLLPAAILLIMRSAGGPGRCR